MRSFAPGIALIAALAWVYRHLFRGELLAGRDVLRLGYPDAHFLLECVRQGEWPLWNPRVFLGQPFAATLQAQAFYPPRVVFALLFGPYWGVSLLQVFHAGIAVAGAFLAARALGTSRIAAAVAGGTFGLSPLFTELSGTPNLVSAAAWSGWILLAAVRCTSVRAAAGVAVWVALSALAGAPETLLWQGWMVVAWMAVRRRPTRGSASGGLASRAATSAPTGHPLRPVLRRSGLLALGGVWGAAIAAVVLLPALEFAAQSSRSQGKGSSLDWSASWAQLLALAWPRADQPRGPYWGSDQWLLLELFIGTGVVLLAAMGVRRRRKATLALAGVAAALALLALGRNFTPSEWILSLPGLRSFRYPAKALVGAAFCVSLLAAFGLDRVRALARRSRGPVTNRRAILGAVAIIGVVVVVSAIGIKIGARATSGWGGAWLCVVAATMWAVLAGWPAARDRGRKVGCAIAGIVALELSLFHVVSVGTSLATADRLRAPSPIAALAQGGRVSIDFRPAVKETPPGASGPIEVTRGLDAVAEESRRFGVPNRFVEDGLSALEGYGAPEPPRIQQFHLARQRAIYDLAGVGLFVRADSKPFDDLEDVTPDPSGPTLSRSRTAFPRAFVVHRARSADDATTLAALSTSAEAARTTVFLATAKVPPLDDCDGSAAKVLGSGANFVEVEVEACGRGILVLTDSYFPGWHADVDGVASKVLRANHALRGVEVPRGKHRVTFRYLPWTFTVGGLISALALVAAVGVTARTRRGSGDAPGALSGRAGSTGAGRSR